MLRVEGVDLKAPLDQPFGDRAVRNLDGDEDLFRRLSAAGFHQPVGHFGEALAAVFEELLAEFAALVVGQEDAMALASPVDADIPTIRIAHGRTSHVSVEPP